MKNIYESLLDYFENTPKDILDKDWEELEYLNEIGPDVIEYAEYVINKFGLTVSYTNPNKTLNKHKFNVSVDGAKNERIAVDAEYYFAA